MPNPMDVEEIEFDDEELEESQESPEEAEPETRRERRAARPAEREREREAALEEARRANERLARVEGELAALRSNREPAEDPEARANDEMEELYRARERAGNALVAELRSEQPDQERVKDLRRQVAKTEQDHIRAMTRAELTAHQRQHQPSPEQAQQQQAAQRFAAMYPDVAHHPNASHYVRGRLYAESGGDPNFRVTQQLVEQVVSEARQRYGMAAQAPTDQMRAATTGFDGSAGAGGPSNVPKTFTMTQEDKAMADMMFPEIEDDGKRYREYAKFHVKQKQA